MDARVALGLTDTERTAAVVALAEEAGDVTVLATPQTSDEVVTLLAQTEVEVLVLDEELGPLPVLELARQLQEKHPAVGLLLLAAGEASPDLLRQALRAGFRDVLSAPLTVEALDDATKRAASWARAVRERSEADDLARVAEHIGGQIIAIAGAKGGVGCSTVALHVALAAAGHDAERPVALAELDLQAGDLRSLLDLQSHRSIADLAGVAGGEITARSLDDTLYVHSSGLRVLVAPERGEDGEDVDAAAARQILGALKFQYDIVVCDVGSVMTEAGAVAVEMASHVLVVTTPDVPAIRATNRLLRLWERLQIDTPARVLLNRTSREQEIQPDFARRVIDAPVLDTTIPAGFRDLEEPLNTGHPERLEQGAISRALTDVAVALEAVPATGPRRRLRLRRAAKATAGQTTVEMLGLLPIVLVCILGLVQLVAVGYTFMETSHAAQAGARAWAVDDDKDWWTRAAKDQLPKDWRDDAKVEALKGKDGDGVRVTVQVPSVLPVPASVARKLQIVEEKRTVAEE
jgi:pilus assembly protein CpaE